MCQRVNPKMFIPALTSLSAALLSDLCSLARVISCTRNTKRYVEWAVNSAEMNIRNTCR